MTSPIGILLCAGKGTRMQNERTHKVCYEIAGVPAILRLIRSLKEGGISRFLVVVGNKCEKVMACLDGVEGVAYAYQPEQRGTGVVQRNKGIRNRGPLRTAGFVRHGAFRPCFCRNGGQNSCARGGF